MNKILVITANFGGIDKIKEIPKQTFEFDRVYITEENSPYDFAGLNNRLKAKYFKWQMHKLYPNYDFYIWVDGNIQIKTSDFIERMVVEIIDGDICMSVHQARNCIYEEAAFIIDGINTGNKYLKARYDKSIQNEVDYYRSQNHPENAGLYWCGLFIVRNHTVNNCFFNCVWEDQILRSNFDQNSFVFHALNHEIKINTIEWGSFHKNENYELINHSKLI